MKREILRIESMRQAPHIKRIDLQFYEGEVQYCIFDNAQEKRKFIQFLSSGTRLDFGKVYIEEQMKSRNLEEKFQDLITVIERESNLIGELSIGENLFIARKKSMKTWITINELEKYAEEIFSDLGVSIKAKMPIEKLSLFEKIQIAIVKAYLLGRRIIALPDIYSCLTNEEKREFWELVQRLKQRGTMFIIFDLLECLEFAKVNTISIIKNGRTAIAKNIEECDYTMLHTILYQDSIQKNVGIWQLNNSNSNKNIAIKNISTKYLRKISFEIKKNTITKVYCVDEKSFIELSDVLTGNKEFKTGKIEFGEIQTVEKQVSGVKHGVGVIHMNILDSLLFEELTVMDNLLMCLGEKVRGIWLTSKYKKSIMIQLIDIIDSNIFERKVKSLSAVDLVKVAYCKWLLYFPKLLVCIQPFSEGDLETKNITRYMLDIISKRGIPVVIVTINRGELNYCQGEEVYIKNGINTNKESVYELVEKI